MISGAEVAKAVAIPAGALWEVVQEESHHRKIGWADKRPSLVEAADSFGVSMRVIKEGRQGIVSSKGSDVSSLSSLAAEALKIAELSARDSHRRLAGSEVSYPADIPVEGDLFHESADSVLAKLESLEKILLRTDARLKKVIKFHLVQTREKYCLVNAHGLDATKESTSSHFVAEIMAQEGKNTEVSWDFQGRRFSKNLTIEKCAQDAADHAALSLGGKTISSGNYSAVIHPRVGYQLLSLVEKALSAEAVERGRSFFAGRINSSIASSCVTLIDDPFLSDGVASAPFDDEGVPHETISVVENGLLNTYFYDLRTASKQCVPSNGHGRRAGLGAAPSPAATNFYLKPGKAGLGDMLASSPKIFHIHDVMGLHMADPISGEFSLGASGFLYEKGRLKQPVRGVTIAGKIGDIFKKVEAVGDDLTWHGALGTPHFLVSELTVAGH